MTNYLSKNLSYLLEISEENTSTLGAKIGVDQSTLHRLLLKGTTRPRVDTLSKIAKFYNLEIEELIGSDLSETEISIQSKDVSNATSYQIPVISWVQAGAFSEAIDLHLPDYAEEYVASSIKPRRHTFALRVQGDSMETLFHEGMIITVEPDMSPEIGQFVIAKNGNNEATFKQLTKDGSTYYLKPLNPRYGMIKMDEEGYTIIGVVREAVIKLA